MFLAKSTISHLLVSSDKLNAHSKLQKLKQMENPLKRKYNVTDLLNSEGREIEEEEEEEEETEQEKEQRIQEWKVWRESVEQKEMGEEQVIYTFRDKRSELTKE